MPWRGCYKKQVSKKVLEQMLLQDLHAEAWKYPGVTQIHPGPVA